MGKRWFCLTCQRTQISFPRSLSASLCLSSRMNPLLSVSLWLALSVLVCCENSEKEDWDHYDYTEFNQTDYISLNLNLTDYNDFNLTDPDDFNLTDLDYSYDSYVYTEFSTDLVHTSFKEDESNFRNKASGIGQLKLVFLLGLAILQIWN
ncbi:hypothetical protein ACER0C_016204 [Sarotherodon galilaeus]